MEGIVTLLEGEDRERIEQIWSELRDELGVRGIHRKRFPHFSYHVAEKYDLQRVRAGLEAMARDSRPFCVQASGLGIFTRKEPVVHLPVTRTQELESLHCRVGGVAAPAATSANEYYASSVWIPHITIAEGDVDILVLPEIVRRFGERNLRWDLRVTNLAVIRAVEDVQEICFRCDFG